MLLARPCRGVKIQVSPRSPCASKPGCALPP
jgi:hypothetical protein